MAQKITYSFKTGLLKSLKNTAVVVGIPALVLFIDNWTTIIPDEWNVYAAPIMGFLSYLVKNFLQNKN